MVSANPRQELQNVLPKCNPSCVQIEYTIDRDVGICRWQIRIPAHLNILVIAQKLLPLSLHSPHVVHNRNFNISLAANAAAAAAAIKSSNVADDNDDITDFSRLKDGFLWRYNRLFRHITSLPETNSQALTAKSHSEFEESEEFCEVSAVGSLKSELELVMTFAVLWFCRNKITAVITQQLSIEVKSNS